MESFVPGRGLACSWASVAGPLPAVPVTFLGRVHRVRVPAAGSGMASGRSRRRTYGDVRHLIIVVSASEARSLWLDRDDQQQLNPGRTTPKPATSWGTTPAGCCSFEMIRASFATRVGKRGVFTLYMDRRGPRSQRVSARTTDQREIRCERQTVAAAYQPAHRRRSRQGAGQVRHPSCAESDLAQQDWQGQARTSRPRAVRMQFPCSQDSSAGCATS